MPPQGPFNQGGDVMVRGTPSPAMKPLGSNSRDHGPMKGQITGICRRYDVVEVYVFGSRSREVLALVSDECQPFPPSGSDVDIGVLPADREPWSPRKRVALTMELEVLFQVDRVDLVLLPEADAFLALDIIRGELLFSDDLDRQARYELFVLRRAGDLAHYQRKRIRTILGERKS